MALDWYALARANGFATPEEMIHKYYVEDGLSLSVAAEEVGCSVWALRARMFRAGIAVRPCGGARQKKRRTK